jgi:hypothetical protein
MTLNISTGTKNLILSGGIRDEFLEDCHEKFQSGDRSAMLEALIACSL